MGEQPKISIIIPFKEMNDYVEECIKRCLELDYDNFEILLLPDSPMEHEFPKTRAITTGPVKPSLKRNTGISESDGEICAFIDSDAYPTKDWLKNSLKYLEDETVGIVGGPNLVPEEDSVWQKASDDVLSSGIGAGIFALRYILRKGQPVKELPSCNLIAKKALLNKVGGFDTSLLTAEDAKVCFQVRQLGKKVIYSPDVIVYHHRRALFRPHFKQMWIYGRDKAYVLTHGFFSLDKMYYFLPSLFVLFLIFGFLVSFNPWITIPYIKIVYQALLVIYIFIVAVTSLAKSLKRSILIFPGIMLTHVFYGIGFLYGLTLWKRGE